MKRLIAVLSGLLVLPAFAEVAPIYYDEVVEYTDAEVADENTAENDAVQSAPIVTPVVQPSKVNPRGASGASRTASRVVPSTGKSVNSRAVSTRTSSSRNATQARTGTVTARNAVTTRGTTTARVAARPSRSATTTAGVTARRAVANTGVAARAGALTQTDTVNTPLYTGRVSTRSVGAIQSRMPSFGGTTTAKAGALSELTDIDELAQNTDYCKAQYTACMDNFCNVLDDNQGRCSCSKNLDNYAETEEALKQATIALEEVAQQIRYIGLTADQVESLFAETEAEIALSEHKNNDASDITNQLAKVKKMIITIEPGSVSKTDTGISFNVNGMLEIGNLTDGLFNLDSLNIFGNSSKTNSISNQRGEQLYKTAAARCKTSVLDACTAQGVDASIITNSYDLEIDKQCIAYERNLTEANETMASTVRNAKVVLQNARLMVAQQKNAFTLRECVEELDSCMREDFVCGDDYENCLDPTGRYIAGGKIVLGSTPGVSTVDAAPVYSLYATWNYGANNPQTYTWSTNGTLGGYIDSYLTGKFPEKDLQYMANHLQSKIGYIDETGKAVGMCAGILNQCQDYTYTTDGKKRSATKKYNPGNQVIRNYLERTLVQIKAAQDALVEEYADDCISQEVLTCLNQNDFDETYSNVALKACQQQITTCMSVNGETPQGDNNTFTPGQMKEWALNVIGEDSAVISDYMYTINCTDSGGKISKDSTTGAYVCKCEDGYTANDTGTCSPTDEKLTCEQGWKSVLGGGAGTWDGEKCVCANNAYTYDNDSGCCISNKVSACIESNGQWKNNGCECNGGYVLNSSTNECEPTDAHNKCVSADDTVGDMAGTWENNKCACPSGSILSGTNCIEGNIYDCVRYNGTWDSGSCTCPELSEWKNNKCTAIEGAGWTGSSFQCYGDYTKVDGKCVNLLKESCESIGGTWDSTADSCDCPELSEWKNNECTAIDGAAWTGSSFQCNSDYTNVGGKCVNVLKTNCESKGGTWGSSSCTCPELSEWKNNECTAIDGAAWTGSSFQCYNNYKNVNGKCVNLKANCESTGGTWDEEYNRCDCSYTNVEGKCVNVRENCESTGGTWDEEYNRCDCPHRGDGEGGCISEQEVCEFTGGTWENNKCVCFKDERASNETGVTVNQDGLCEVKFGLSEALQSCNNMPESIAITQKDDGGVYYITAPALPDSCTDGTNTYTAKDLEWECGGRNTYKPGSKIDFTSESGIDDCTVVAY